MNRNLPGQRLGIMATELPRRLPFASSDYYRNLCLLGGKEGIEVFVFSANRIDWIQEKVPGYTYHSKSEKWIKKLYPIPQLVYDRCFFATHADYLQYQRQVQKLRVKATHFLGNGLSGKWDVLQMLRLDPYFKTYLPKTVQLKRIESLFALPQTKPQLFLKPQSGSQGRSVLRVIYSKENDGSFEVTGRDGRNRPFHKTFQQSRSFKLWLSRFVGKRAYLIQEYLSLHTDQGMAYDIRSLVQKNGRGLWVTTGMAVRCGKPGSVTSNLHGGGTAEEVMPFLIQQFGAEKAEELKQSLDDLSARIPLALESSRGRLAELGIDFGIDRMANLWILEVNSKPGRDIFKQLHNTQARRLSLLHPIQYAGFLLQRKPN